MRLIVGLICAVTLFGSAAFAQEWEVQSYEPSTSAVRDIVFVNPDIAIIVGEAHPMMRSTDGGLTWAPVDLPILSPLRRIFFLDEQHGWAVGALGVILFSSDGGASWVEQVSGVETMLRGVDFIDESTGWVVGWDGVLLHTVDGGETWDRIEVNLGEGWDDDLLDVNFLDSQTGWIVGGQQTSIFAQTQDGGETWEVSRLSSIAWLMDFHVFEDGTIIRSGKSHYSEGCIERIEPDTTYRNAFINCPIVDLCFLNDTFGYAIGSGTDGGTSILLVTSDGGITWEQTSLGYHQPYAVAFTTPEDGLIGTDYEPLLLTENGGENWSSVLPSRTNLVSVDFADPLHGGALSEDCRFFRTTDGGESWSYVSDLPHRPVSQPLEYSILHLTSASDVWALSKDRLLYHSIDFGETWAVVYVQATNLATDFIVSDGNFWIIAGTSIWYSSDGGVMWEFCDPGNEYPLYFTDFVNSNVGFAISGSSILRTLDGGCQWEVMMTSDYHYYLYDLDMLDAQTGYVVGMIMDDEVGDRGVVYKTVDGGLNWTLTRNELISSFYFVQFLDSLTGWAYAHEVAPLYSHTGGSVLYTPVSGLGWDVVDLPLITVINDFVIQAPYVWAVGDFNTILRYTIPQSVNDGMISIPTQFSLSAYPNPFNPTTTLSFDLPQAGRVQLQVFDITGRLVNTLEDRVMQAGNYQMIWNADRYSSGIYFANLRSTNQNRTQKLILIK